MIFNAGSRLGPYEILDVIDEGGMGEVYRARDTRLERTVAIKIITAEHAHDPTMRLRFEREAKALSNLRHPHICAFYDIGETGDVSGQEGGSVPYLVMEYLEGHTLSEILQRGPLTLDRILRYGTEIADALHKAHRQHILHRDLKLSNIMITEDGASLLDFGLAKILTPAVTRDPQVETRSDSSTDERSLTPSGDVVGTAHYLSPEQLEGKQPDVRTDIFALGVCLYQMATRERPFDGTSRAGLIASILSQEPAVPSSLRPDIPASLDWVIKTCLAKDPEERFQTAHDVRLELERIAETTPAPLRQTPRSRTLWVVAILIALGLIGAVYLGIKTRPSGGATTPVAVRRLSIGLTPDAPLLAGNIEKLAVAPDGGRIAYIADGDPPSLYSYSLEERVSKPIAQTGNARNPFFSPDGRWIGFSTADGYLKKVSVDGGAPITIGRTGDVRGATWGDNDQIVFGARWSQLKVISARGGAVNVVPQESTTRFDSRWPSFLPGGKRVLYTLFDMSGDYDNAQLAVFDLESRKNTIVLKGATHGRFLPPGQLVYFRSGSLFSVPFDIRTLQVTGDPTPRVSDVDYYFVSGLAQFEVAADGTLFYVPRDPAMSNGEVAWVDRKGGIASISPTRRAFRQPRISPDGTQIIVTVDEGPNTALWLYDIPGQRWQRLASTIGTAIWAPDGKRVAFSNTGSGGVNVFIMPTDSTSPPRQVTHTTRWPFASSWSPDGRELAVVESFKETLTDIYIVPADGGSPRPFLTSPSNENAAMFSSDGSWIAYSSDESGQYEIYVTRYPQGGKRWLVSTGGGIEPEWRRDGRELFYQNGAKFMAVDVKQGTDFSSGKPRVLFESDFRGSFNVAADGSRFLIVKREKPTPRTQINVVSGLSVR
jgi:Tol biopolymer transport system component